MIKDVEIVIKGGNSIENQQLIKYYDSLSYVSSWNNLSLTHEQILNFQDNDPNKNQLSNPVIIIPERTVDPCRIRLKKENEKYLLLDKNRIQGTL